ncbi:hypothetical protein ABW19_dt0202186 [Dactylella cylindrospora]|nr:hypothetical protein ABW19_dt0202186 [Dactylella cylindrospora]
MPPRKRVKSESDEGEGAHEAVVHTGHTHKRRRIEAPSSAPTVASASIKMERDSQPLRRSARLQKAPSRAPSKETAKLSRTITKSRKSQKSTSALQLKTPKNKPTTPSKRKQEATEGIITPPKRQKRKATASQEEPAAPKEPQTTTEEDAEGNIWIAMPYVAPQELYDFSAEFYVPPLEKVQINVPVGPPPVIVRLHIIDKKTGEEVPCDNDRERYYWAVAHILHEDSTPCTEPEFVNKNQRSETPMSSFHEEPVEDTRTPVTRTPPPDRPIRRWKTFVTFPSIVIPAIGRYRIKITVGVFIDQKLRTADGKEKVKRAEYKDLVTITSDVVQVQEDEPEDEDQSEFLHRTDLYKKMLAEREAFLDAQAADIDETTLEEIDEQDA